MPFRKQWQALVNLIIRPLRCEYNPEEHLGPSQFTLRNQPYIRYDFTVQSENHLHPAGPKRRRSFFGRKKSAKSACGPSTSSEGSSANSSFVTESAGDTTSSESDSYAEEGADAGRHSRGVSGSEDASLKSAEAHEPFTIQCSWWMPESLFQKFLSSQCGSEGEDVDGSALPCVIYCHGNCGSRCDSLDAVDMLLGHNISVCAFDFSGSGLSDGEYVTLGYQEKYDLKAVIQFLRSSGVVSTIGLWGRSMGAATSIMTAAEDPSIACCVLDSAFSDLSSLMEEVVRGVKSWIPKLMINIATKMVRRSVRARAGFDIFTVSPMRSAPQCFVPVLFVHGDADTFIGSHHSEQLYSAYAGEDKKLIHVEDGTHNSCRPPFAMHSIAIFFLNGLIRTPSGEMDNLRLSELEFQSPSTYAEMFTAHHILSGQPSYCLDEVLADQIGAVNLVEESTGGVYEHGLDEHVESASAHSSSLRSARGMVSDMHELQMLLQQEGTYNSDADTVGSPLTPNPQSMLPNSQHVGIGTELPFDRSSNDLSAHVHADPSRFSLPVVNRGASNRAPNTSSSSGRDGSSSPSANSTSGPTDKDPSA